MKPKREVKVKINHDDDDQARLVDAFCECWKDLFIVKRLKCNAEDEEYLRNLNNEGRKLWTDEITVTEKLKPGEVIVCGE